MIESAQSVSDAVDMAEHRLGCHANGGDFTIANRFSPWGLLLETLDHLHGDGVLVVKSRETVVFVNRQFRELFGLPPGFPKAGDSLQHLFDRFIERGNVMSGSDGGSISAWPIPDQTDGPQTCHVRMGDGRILQVTGQRLSNGALSYTCTDLFDRRMALEQLRHAYKSAAINLATMAEFWDARLGDHLHRVSRMTAEITAQLYRNRQFLNIIDEHFREEVATSSILHDVGKFSVPESVVRKAGLLTPDEMDLMKAHSQSGAALLERGARLAEGVGYLSRGAEIALNHHERYDGSGYPNGIGASEIPVSARIVAVADVFDALASARSYKPAWSPERAAAHVVEQSGAHFDPKVVDAFQQILLNRTSVEVVRWTHDMSVGIATIDRDHRILVGLLNQLAAAEDCKDRINIEEVLDEFVSYTLYHFDKEECLMATCGYPEIERHKEKHRGFTELVLSIRHRFFEDEPEGLGDEILAILVAWLRGHIMGEDRKFAPYMVGLPIPGERTRPMA